MLVSAKLYEGRVRSRIGFEGTLKTNLLYPKVDLRFVNRGKPNLGKPYYVTILSQIIIIIAIFRFWEENTSISHPKLDFLFHQEN